MRREMETRFYRLLPEGTVLCTLCPQACRLQEGERGRCRVRFRRGDKIYLSSYGQISALALDPMEKKPLYHFYPRAAILSVGTVGCNLQCDFCQNWEIAHGDAPTEYLSPEDLVELADKYRAQGNIGLAYTYSEPLIWYEYVYDTARLAREKGLKNVLVTNGYLNPEPLRELLPFIDAVNLDIKAWEDDFYRRRCEGRVGPVKKAAEIMAGKVHLEVTNLLIPGENDREEEIRELVRFLAGLDRRIPLHFSRYFPNYRLQLPPTPPVVLEKAYKIAKEELYYVYVGNISTVDGRMGYNRTNCPDCGQALVERTGFAARVTGVDNGRCGSCGREVDLVLPDEGG
ncbi:MAG: AmmeMemoRadiSam system radical SAM enzyme [Firmicutes bacterium]|nr:AmmeMemoRadiSam system radical SAM enzyme [Bacillota bacterium]